MKLKEQVARAICKVQGQDPDEIIKVDRGMGGIIRYYQQLDNAEAAINVTVGWLETEAERLEDKYFASAATYRAIAKQLAE